MKLILQFLCILALVLLGGCNPQKRPNVDELAIVPGVGIPNVIELGMTLRQVKRSGFDVEISSSTNSPGNIVYGGEVPALGADFQAYNDRSTLTLISFIVEHPTAYARGYVYHKFHGSLADTISFETNKYVMMSEVLKLFGEPTYHVNAWPLPKVSSDAFNELRSEIKYYTDQGIPHSISTGENVIGLSYPNLGMVLFFMDDQLYLIHVCKKVDAKTENKETSNQGMDLTVAVAQQF